MQNQDLNIWRKSWQEEVDAQYLYGVLTETVTEDRDRKLYRELGGLEGEHVDAWEKLLREKGVAPGKRTPTVKSRLLAWMTRRFGSNFLRQYMAAWEGREVREYLLLHQRAKQPETRALAKQLAMDSAEHEQLQTDDDSKESWHSAESGGMLRNVIYGFNDGLTANFGLIAGVVGASVQPHLVVVSGLAGVLADALSMGSSGYLAAKSEAEVYENERRKEKLELAVMPEVEARELSLIYQSKGMQAEEADRMVQSLMADKQAFLEEKMKQELELDTSAIHPLREGWITGLATAIGAIIPVAPFLVTEGTPAIAASFVISMFAHFAVGAARSFFTGQNFWKSGIEMFVVGFGIAVAGYFLGEWLIEFL
ncbi:MAG: VIT1/CCC1 transporter family protein [Saprospiraceae bacterium]|nr:VIT1/CCC1 transporter family protein [Saprospiraceae bacterium]